MPVNRLKLMAFVVRRGIAGFAGAIYGSVQTGAFPGDFDVGAADHDLRDRDPRRRGQPRRRDRRGDGRQRRPGAPARPEPGASGSSTPYPRSSLFARRCGRGGGSSVVGGTSHSGSPSSRCRRRLAPRGRRAPVGEGELAHAVGSLGRCCRAVRRVANWAYVIRSQLSSAYAAPRLVARGRARADALPRRARLGDGVDRGGAGLARWLLFGSILVALMAVRPQGLFGTPRVEIV